MKGKKDMKKICTLCAALLVTLSLAACASGPNAAEQVIGTEGTVAMEDIVDIVRQVMARTKR